MCKYIPIISVIVIVSLSLALTGCRQRYTEVQTPEQAMKSSPNTSMTNTLPSTDSTTMKTPPSSIHITITTPRPKSTVKYRESIEGTVSDPNTCIVVAIRPTTDEVYWVQGPPAIDKDGSWQVTGYFGRDPDHDSGILFDVVAFVTNNTDQFAKGSVIHTADFENLPRTNYIKVTRL